MEIQAALEALRTLGAEPGLIQVVSDSTYVVNCFRDRWWAGWQARGWVNSKRQPVANRDLWEPLITLVQERGDVELPVGEGPQRRPDERPRRPPRRGSGLASRLLTTGSLSRGGSCQSGTNVPAWRGHLVPEVRAGTGRAADVSRRALRGAGDAPGPERGDLGGDRNRARPAPRRCARRAWAAWRPISAGVAPKRGAGFGSRMVPIHGRSCSTSDSLWITCGSVWTSPTRWMMAHGTSSALSSATSSPPV